MTTKYNVPFEKKMTKGEKKLYVEAVIAQGDKRSYNEIMADLELRLWKKRWM